MTERWLSGDTEEIQLPAKRQKPAVTATCSAAVEAIFQRNASTSPLFKLPREIRNIIFSYVIGHQFIHLVYRSAIPKFHHALCTAAMSEDEAYNEFVSGHSHISSIDPAGHHSISFRERHARCSPWSARDGLLPYDPSKINKPMLNLSILRACRQIYEEANVLLWTTNTFSFERHATLQIFVGSLHWTQRKMITRVHIDFAWDTCFPFVNALANPFHTFQIILPQFTSFFSFRLTRLSTVHVTFTEPIGNYLESGVFGLFHMIQALPLRHVTAVCDEFYELKIPERMWSIKDRRAIDERREVAERLRKKLLEPKGLKPWQTRRNQTKPAE